MDIEDLVQYLYGKKFNYLGDGLTALQYYLKMLETNDRLKQEFGSGAAAGTDDYYHPLLQCVLAQRGKEHADNGIDLGYWKEVFDYFKKQGKQTDEEIWKDTQKDLQNNRYGNIIGRESPLADCRDLLEDKRTPNMRKLGIK